MFKILDPEFAKRLDELRCESPTTLDDEIALSRLLAENAVNHGSMALAAQILHSIGKLELLRVQQQERLGDLLSRHSLFEAGSRICDAITARLSSRPDYPELVDLILPCITESLKNVGREAPLQLTHEKQDD